MDPLVQLPLHANGHLFTGPGTVKVLRPGDGEEPILLGAPYTCGVCAEEPAYRVEHDGVHVADPCRYPEGITTEITLNVPSGRLVVADDLRPVYGWDPDKIADYNSVLGQTQAVEAMAACGCAFGYVGNTCPGLYRTGPDTLVIASRAEEDAALPDSARLAGIVTDLWAYSIADLHHWQDRGGDLALRPDARVVEVPAGSYRFTHHTGERGFDPHAAETVTFAHIRRTA